MWTWDFDQGSVELDLAFNAVEGYANPIRYEKILVFGAGPSWIRARVMTPNWPNPLRAAKNRSEFLSWEHVTSSPAPAKILINYFIGHLQ